MSGYYGPGPVPGAGPRGTEPSGHGVRVLGLAAMALLLVATAVSFALTRSGGSRTAFAATTPSIRIGGTEPGIRFPSTSDPTRVAPSTSAGGGLSASPMPPGSTGPSPTVPRTTTPVRMSAAGVRNVLSEFFDGYRYHRLADVRGAVCPEYRYLYTTTYSTNPKGFEIQKWRSRAFTVNPDLPYVDVYVAATLHNRATNAVYQFDHTWRIILRSRSYYICGGT